MHQQSKETKILYMKASKHGKRSTDGDILVSAKTCNDLNASLELYLISKLL